MRTYTFAYKCIRMCTFTYVLFQFVTHMCTNVFKINTNAYIRIYFLQKYVKNSHYL